MRTRFTQLRRCNYWVALGALLLVVSSPLLAQSGPTVNYRSIGINPNVLHHTGTAIVDAGSTTVTFDDGTPLPSHIGIGDRLTLEPGGDAEETLYLLSRDSETQVTVQAPAVYSHPGVDFAITRAFTRIQAWEKARQGDLVADGRREVGVCYKDGPFLGFGAYALATIDGSTTDADHYMHLTVAPGHRHTGTAGTGVVLDGENTTKIGIRPRDDYVRIDGLEFTRFRSEHGAAAIEVGTPSSSKTVERRAHGVLLEDLLIYNFDHEEWSVVGIKGSRASDFTVRNTIIWDGDAAGIRINREGSRGRVENVTVFGMTGRGIYEDDGTLEVTNTIAVGNGRDDFDVERGSTSHNVSTDATAPGPSSLQGVAAAELFVSTAPGAEDLHLIEGAPAIGAGLNLSDRFANDIDGNPRPATGSWDAGADHFGAGDDTPPEIAIASPGELVVNDTTPEIVVTYTDADSGVDLATLRITLNGTDVLPECVVGPASTTCEPQPLAPGQHTIGAFIDDQAGLTGMATLEFELVIDTESPVFLAVLPPDGTVLVISEVLLTGKVRGAVAMTVDGQPATLLGEDFTAGPFLLGEGSRTFLLAAVGAVGNRAELVHTLIRDTTSPVISIGQPSAGAVVSTAAVTVSGSAQDATLAAVSVNGIQATLSSGTFVAAGVPLAEGENELVVTAVDAAGNTSEARRSVTLDTQAPTIAITDPAAGTVLPDETVTLHGTASDPHLDRVEVDGMGADLQGENWSIELALDEGSNTFTARAIDTVGHSAETVREVSRDSTAPEITIESPAEGALLNTETVEVTGTVGEEVSEVTVNGEAADLAGQSFTAAAVPLVDGENRLTVRATDTAGNQGVRTRTVYRDTEAPELLASEPVAGALAVQPDSDFLLTFSEEMPPPPAGAVTLTRLGGEILATTVTRSAERFTVTPDAALPSGADLVLELGVTVIDLAGNPLAAPVALAFTVADVEGPDPPLLDAVPAYHCSTAVVLTGTTEPDARVLVSGGAADAETRAGIDGTFSITVALVPATLNRLEVVAIDTGGNRSPAVVVEIAQDCDSPAVIGAELETEDIVILFSEAVEPATLVLPGAIQLTGASGPVSGTVIPETDGRTARFTPDTGFPGGALRLVVEQLVRDLAGNPLAFPYVRIFGGEGGDSFLLGTVIDDATGRPLTGAEVAVVARDGVPLPEP
ncbi:MAG: Ig-like domain-containing protein, partial [Thermoanaerobaculia bacterium]